MGRRRPLLRRWGRQLTCWLPARWYRRFPPVTGTAGSRLHETHLPGRIIVQPVQLSLLPEQVPAPPAVLTAQLPETPLATALVLLAALITRAAARDAAMAAAGVSGGE
jgi:hypothetical protein